MKPPSGGGFRMAEEELSIGGLGQDLKKLEDGKRVKKMCLRFVGGDDVLLNDMGVSKNRGTPKWMVYNGKPY